MARAVSSSRSPIRSEVPRLLELLRHLGEALQVLRGLLAEELLDIRGIDLLEARRILRLSKLALELLHLGQLVHELHGLAQRERVVALEVVAPAHLVERHELVEVHGELRQGRVQALVLGEERLHHLL
jgi:hypothetical protein